MNRCNHPKPYMRNSMSSPAAVARILFVDEDATEDQGDYGSLNNSTPAQTPKMQNGDHLGLAGIARQQRIFSTTLFMDQDNTRPIDFVLAYQPKESGQKSAMHAQYRKEFEKNLIEEGLELEYEGVEQSQDGKTCFVKVHAPFEVLARTAEINRIKMPIRVDDDTSEDNASQDFVDRLFQKLGTRNPFRSELCCIERPKYFTAAFNRDRASQFLIQDKHSFFSSTQRIRMVWDLILRTHVRICREDNKQVEPVGIQWLLREKIYVAAYPLHDGDPSPQDAISKADTFDSLKMEESGTVSSFLEMTQKWPLRRLLYNAWTRPKNWFKYQPLDYARDYYGEKIAIYFAWLGFYTRMLILPSIVGLLCFLYGLIWVKADIPRYDMCKNPDTSNITICRMCSHDTVCPFRPLKSSCLFASLGVVFDNPATVVFALFMSVWSVIFLEMWKRHQAELCWEWGVTDAEFVEESVRPEYQSAVKTQRKNPVTHEIEPYLPPRDKAHRLLASATTVVFMVTVVLSVMAAIIFYRIIGIGLYTQVSEQDPFLHKVSAPVITSITAAVINAICILILERVYERLAWWLTEREFPRTESEFESSFTYKVFIFQFVNYYAALFYIAFLKGRVFGPPNKNQKIVDRCDAAGCIIDVCIQLAIIMIGKQLLSNFVELGLPILQNWWRRRKNVEETEDNAYTRWEKDFDLNPLPPLGLFAEYLEMIIQFGFVTMFVAAFPLAPLFALLNNIMEIRLDSYKLVTHFRRPVPARAQDIGAWFTILEIVTKIAVITNGLVIAFTSDFIDRMLYVFTVSKDHSLNGYVQHIFSEFDTADMGEAYQLDKHSGTNITHCYYRDYRTPYNSPKPYARSEVWWHVLVARLVFVLIFEHIVFLIQGFVGYMIPDVPEHVSLKIQRENYLAKQAIYNYEFSTAGSKSTVFGDKSPAQSHDDLKTESSYLRKTNNSKSNNTISPSPTYV